MRSGEISYLKEDNFMGLNKASNLRNSQSKVNRCRACEGIETCERWLATHESAEEAPGCCKNAKVLLRLRAEKEKAEA